jgi:hypothetical protein
VLGRPAPLRTDAGSTQYLRTLAAEAGIPVHLMSSDAWRSMIVGMVTDIERFGVACPDALARSLPRGRSTGMPLAFGTRSSGRSWWSSPGSWQRSGPYCPPTSDREVLSHGWMPIGRAGAKAYLCVSMRWR